LSEQPRTLANVDCKCGCGEPVKGRRKFVNKEHQMAWMLNGGARQLNAMLSDEVRQRGGTTAGSRPQNIARLNEIRPAANERATAIANEVRNRLGRSSD
jgi:hypothetical protein